MSSLPDGNFLLSLCATDNDHILEFTSTILQLAGAQFQFNSLKICTVAIRLERVFFVWLLASAGGGMCMIITVAIYLRYMQSGGGCDPKIRPVTEELPIDGCYQ